MESKKANVTICGRKEPGYPQEKFEIDFSNVSDLLKKIDDITEELGWRKVDVYVGPEGLTEAEIEDLEDEHCIISNFS